MLTHCKKNYICSNTSHRMVKQKNKARAAKIETGFDIHVAVKFNVAISVVAYLVLMFCRYS